MSTLHTRTCKSHGVERVLGSAAAQGPGSSSSSKSRIVPKEGNSSGGSAYELDLVFLAKCRLFKPVNVFLSLFIVWKQMRLRSRKHC